MFGNWYTDTVDIYRVINTADSGLTSQTRQLIAEGVPCRIYNTQTNSLNITRGAAQTRADEKLACAIGTDVKAGDELLVTRGGALGRGLSPERYIASAPVAYFDPVGGALTGLEHLQVGLHREEINRGVV